jgi:hypothetical protein
MPEKIRHLMKLAGDEKRLLVHAWLALGCIRMAMTVLPLKRLAASLDHYSGSVSPRPVTREQGEQARRIGRLVATAARLTPWHSRCLAQVLVTQRMLAARRIPGQFCLGVRRDRDPACAAAGFSAHAWLQCGERVVNGELGCERYQVISTFRWSARGR